MLRLALFFCLSLSAACQADETLSAYGGAERTWHLKELDGQAFAAQATLLFPAPGQIAGKAPCNRFSSTMTAPYPWFAISPLAATKMACPDLTAEDAFFEALGQMTQAEVLDTVLILRNEAGREMVFKASD